jgi:hypothetical protein
MLDKESPIWHHLYMEAITMNRIILTKSTQGWAAHHYGPIAAEVKNLFNTTILPTAFTNEAEAGMVKAAIEKLNPGVLVETR